MGEANPQSPSPSARRNGLHHHWGAFKGEVYAALLLRMHVHETPIFQLLPRETRIVCRGRSVPRGSAAQ